LKNRRQKLLEQAWIGDAVLSLYARRHILAEHGKVSSEQLERMTSNRFLTALGEPSAVEAEIGRAYETGGIEAGFQWIEENLLPMYRRQEEKRTRGFSRVNPPRKTATAPKPDPSAPKRDPDIS
jgi:dsRNA-specific ribonuclease